MMWKQQLNRATTRMAAGALAIGLLGGWSLAAPQTPAPAPTQAEDRPEDRAAIRATAQAFLKAFLARDAKAVAAHWTTEGELTNTAGMTVRGRAALEKAFAAALAATPGATATAQPESLRFLSKDAAIQVGVLTVRPGVTEPAIKTRNTSLLVREQGQWLVAQMTEEALDAVSVADLDWMIGDWKSKTGQGAEIHTTYTWAPNKQFIHGQFHIKEQGVTLSGFQVIGVDPETGALHTWSFEADGGIGESDWSRDGDHWVLEATGTLKDGSTLRETNILRRVGVDAFTWQSIDRTQDDDALADLPPVKVTRAKPAG